MKERKLNDFVLKLAQNSQVKEEKGPQYRPPEDYEEAERAMASKDKRMKALYSRYEDVPNVESDNKIWESNQNKKIKGGYRTRDEIEEKKVKQYDMIIGNSIKFVKKDMLNKALKLKKIHEEI